MGLYEERMHEFITKPENFDLAWEVSMAMPQVQRRLKAETLDAFEALAREHAENAGWIADRFGADRVGIYKPTWEGLFCVDFYMGVKTNFNQAFGLLPQTDHPPLAGKQDTIRERTAAVGKANGMKTGGSDIWYLPIGSNYSNLDEMRDLLPQNRDAYVRRLWEELLRWGDEFGPLVDEIVADLKARSF